MVPVSVVRPPDIAGFSTPNQITSHDVAQILQVMPSVGRLAVRYPVAQAKKSAHYSITHRHRCHHRVLWMAVLFSDDYVDNVLINFVAMDILCIGVQVVCRGRQAFATFRYRLVQLDVPSPFLGCPGR